MFIFVFSTENLVEKAQYEEAAEKSMQLETKVCRQESFLILSNFIYLKKLKFIYFIGANI